MTALVDMAVAGCTVDELWDAALRTACMDLDADAGVAMSIVADDRMTVAASFCWPTPLVHGPIPIAPDSQAAFVLDADGCVVADPATERRFVPSRLVTQAGFQTSLSCRVTADGRPLGLLGVHYIDRTPIDADQQSHLALLGSVLALALTHSEQAIRAAHLIDHDALTGLMNRRGVFDALERLVAEQHVGCLMLIDLDGFKVVNDRHGHGVGDHVLQIVGERLRAAIRPTDVVARLSGDEFVVVLKEHDLGRGLEVAERLIGHIEQVIAVPHASITISASIGVTTMQHHDTVLSLLNAADIAMYSAKAAGRGNAQAALATTPLLPRTQPAAISEPTGASFDLVDIDHAIDSLSIVFQPIVDATTFEVTGVEALTRGPVGPLEAPAVLFRIAETWGRLPQLELAAKRLAFAQPVPAGVSLYVNIDPGALTTDGFLDGLLAAWQGSINRNRVVVIELTERHLRSQPGRLLDAIDRCRAAGWTVGLDDVGARAESLTALALVLPDVIKLDIGLINTANRSHLAATTVALASYCENRAVQIVAEGIEREDQAAIAMELGATHLQGYRFGRPGTLSDACSGAAARAAGPVPSIDRPPSLERGTRRAHRGKLLAISRHIESLASHVDSIVLGALQRVENYTSTTRAQYLALARRCGTVGIVGVGVPGGQRLGVHHGSLEPSDPMAECWHVVLLQPEGAIALIARQVDDEAQWYDYRITTDRSIIEPLARRMMRHL